MPYRRKYYRRRRFKRKRSTSAGRYRKRRRYRNGRISVSRGPRFMPDVYYTKHTISQDINIVHDGTTFRFVYSWRGNSVYDPYNTSRRPIGYTELSAIYNRYLVTGCRITVQLTNNSNEAQGHVVLWANQNTTIPSTLSADEAADQPRATHRIMSPNGNHIIRMKRYFKTSMIIARPTDTSNSIAAEIGNNPSLQYWIHFMIRYITVPGSGEQTFGRINMTLYTRWFKHKELENV